MTTRGYAWGAALAVIFAGIMAINPAMPASADRDGKHIHYKVPAEYKDKKNPY